MGDFEPKNIDYSGQTFLEVNYVCFFFDHDIILYLDP